MSSYAEAFGAFFIKTPHAADVGGSVADVRECWRSSKKFIECSFASDSIHFFFRGFNQKSTESTLWCIHPEHGKNVFRKRNVYSSSNRRHHIHTIIHNNSVYVKRIRRVADG